MTKLQSDPALITAKQQRHSFFHCLALKFAKLGRLFKFFQRPSEAPVTQLNLHRCVFGTHLPAGKQRDELLKKGASSR